MGGLIERLIDWFTREPLRNDYLTFDGLSALRLGFAILLLCMILLQNSLGIDIITKVKAS